MTAEYVLRAVDVIGTEVFYTGKAGQEFVSPDLTSAFPFALLQGAQRKAAVLNRMSLMHGWRFMPVGRMEGRYVPASVMQEYAA